jgi:hypothetical protein
MISIKELQFLDVFFLRDGLFIYIYIYIYIYIRTSSVISSDQ